MNRTNTLLLLSACLAAVLLRFVQLPLGYNFSALGALALFSGSLVPRIGLAVALPLLCRAVTDVWLEIGSGHGFYSSMVFDYGAYAVICLLGRLIAPRHGASVIAGGIAAGCVFFLVSNFGVWLMSPDHAYARSLNGLMLCYANGLPFAKGTFAGDIMFSMVFFGIRHLVTVPSSVVSAEHTISPIPVVTNSDAAMSSPPTALQVAEP